VMAAGGNVITGFR